MVCKQFNMGTSFLQLTSEWVATNDQCGWHDAELPWVSFNIDSQRLAQIHPTNPTDAELDILLSAVIYRATKLNFQIEISLHESAIAYTVKISKQGEILTISRYAKHPGAAALDAWLQLLWQKE